MSNGLLEEAKKNLDDLMAHIKTLSKEKQAAIDDVARHIRTIIVLDNNDIAVVAVSLVAMEISYATAQHMENLEGRMQ